MSFSGDVAKFRKDAVQKVDQQVRAITLGLFRDVILASPVGNPTLWKHKAPKGYVGGRFRANWNTSIGSPALDTTTIVDPSGAFAIGNAAKNLGGAGTVTYMSNGLPYGPRLEYQGWSNQSPAGFVRVNVARYAELKAIKV
jgi:hypothetical protein